MRIWENRALTGRVLIATALALLMMAATSATGWAQSSDETRLYLPFTILGDGALPLLGPQEPTSFTIAGNEAIYGELDFNDNSTFEDASRGLIAPLPTTPIVQSNGKVVWDPTLYSFIENDAIAPPSANPSLWRQSKLVDTGGLFKVVDQIYQVRNYDLSNMTIIEGDTGLIVIDPLVSVEVAEAALALYFEHRPARDIVAVIYSHSHVDHWGGVLGVVSAEEVANGVEIYAPSGFLTAATKENVYAGNVMGRRANYMYGSILPANGKQGIGAGLGMGISDGTKSLLAPTVIIDETTVESKIDGLTFEWLMAPDSEAPSEMLWYIPELRALSTAEDATHTMHNVYSLRGAEVRDPLAWSKYLNEAIERWSPETDVLYGMHHWPIWETEAVFEHLVLQRDLYRFINDQTLNLANRGYGPTDIAEMLELPAVQQQTWSSRGYYGTLNHNVKAAYDLYLGWFDGNPAHLHELPPVEKGKRYVEAMGGPEQLLIAADAAYDQGDYRWVVELVNHLVFADPNNEDARVLQANALEQLGYQAESGPWRNFYLSGAEELRNGVDRSVSTNFRGGVEIISVAPLDLIFDFMAITLNAQKSAGQVITLNWSFTDRGDIAWTLLDNEVINHTLNQFVDGATTIIVDTSVLGNVLLGELSAEDATENGLIVIDGDDALVFEFFSLLESFPRNFNIVTPHESLIETSE